VGAAPPSPLDLLEVPFLRTALAELALLAVIGGLLGTWIVLRGLAFFSHAVGTATFPGLVVARGAGFSPRLAALAVVLGYAGGVERAGRRARDPGDTATALLLVAALGGGVVLASDVFESGGEVDGLLFGTLLGLDGGDVAFSAAVAVATVVASAALGSAWAALAFDPESASALGLPVVRAELLLLALIGVAAVAAVSAVGALLVTSLLVVPAAAARLLARSVRALLAWSVALAALTGLLGLYLAYWLDVPPGPAAAVVGACLFALAAARR
jgi:manganese/iron transport system permease protein